LVGAGLCRFNRLPAFGLAAGLAVVVFLSGVSLSYFTNFWFPWLIVVGGQIPCALAVALVPAKIVARQRVPSIATTLPSKTVLARPSAASPETPDYELFDPPFGEGGFGKVWLARNAIGQWQALKAVYQAKFGSDPGPYEAEFKGIKRFKPVSEKHPGLLRIDFVSRMKPEGYFYYVMELGDAQTPGWQENPSAYKPRDLSSVRTQAEGGRLLVPFCVRVAVVLAEGLDYLHKQGLTHRDIKPSNVIFVNDRPKLADVGLVTEIRTSGQASAFAGTAGYMPPSPEPPGTVAADIYALGMLLYVISTGRAPAFFPELSTALMEESGRADFLRLNAIILKACQPDRAARYKSAAEMAAALLQVQQAL
jgi:serine/threonine protein kinase